MGFFFALICHSHSQVRRSSWCMMAKFNPRLAGLSLSPLSLLVNVRKHLVLFLQ